MKPQPDILALDPGGSKCEALLVRADGTVLGWGRAARPGRSGRSLEVMLRAARRALGRRSAPALRVGVLNCAYPVAAALVRQLRATKLHLFDESEGPLALYGESSGMVVVAGTGARVSVRTQRGRYLTLDGMGPMLGDVGGGYEIGRAALRASVQAVWHPRHRTRLRDRIFDACEQMTQTGARAARRRRPPPGMRGVMAYSVAAKAVHSRLGPSAVRLHNLVHFSLLAHDRSVIAALAAVVNAEAEAGDAVARRILRQAAAGLAETVRDATDRLGIARQPYLVVGAGSVAVRSDLYWRHFCRRVKVFAPRFVFRRLTCPPVLGNALVVLLQLNREDPARLRRRLLASYAEFQRA